MAGSAAASLDIVVEMELLPLGKAACRRAQEHPFGHGDGNVRRAEIRKRHLAAESAVVRDAKVDQQGQAAIVALAAIGSIQFVSLSGRVSLPFFTLTEIYPVHK